jgi:predicted MFS family arabinose efflux permease
MLFLREHREGKAGRFDLPGFVLSGAGLALVLYALSQGPEKGWRSPPVLATGIIGTLLFILLIYVETHVPEPLLALRLFRERMFRNSNIVLSLTYGSFAGTLFLLPLFLQQLRGLSALQSGLTTFPQAIGVIISSQLVGRLYQRVGPRRLIFFGMVGMSAVTMMLAFVGLGTDLWWIRLIMFGRGICMAFAFVPLQAATYANISPADTGRASAIYSTVRQVSAALGVAVLTTVLLTRSSAARGRSGALAGFHAAFFIAGGLVICAAVSGLLIRDEDAASTMRDPTKSDAPALAAAGD